MTDANKSLVRRWYDEVWNQGRAETIDELLSPAATSHGLADPEAVTTGPAEFKAAHSRLLSTFSDMHIRLDELVAEGDCVAVRWTVTMAHSGDGLGFPGTGRSVRMAGSSFIRIEDGHIVEGWNQMDFTRVVQELQAAGSRSRP